MREDKLIRPAAQSGIDGPLLAAAKRAAMRNDQATLEKIVAQLAAMAQVALSTSDNKELRDQCATLARKLKAIIGHPGGELVMETKGLALKREPIDDFTEVEAVKRGAIAGVISGYGATFNNVDYGGDKILRGAFTKSLNDWKKAGRLPVMLAQHDSGSFPIGVWTSMTEDPHGLRVVGNIADTPRGREALALIHMSPPGLDGMSIGYSSKEVDVGRDGTRLLKELELFEVSIVGLPMNPLARIDIGKSRSESAYARLSAAFTSLRQAVLAEEVAERGDNIIRFPSSAAEDIDEAEALRLLNVQIRTATERMRKHRC